MVEPNPATSTACLSRPAPGRLGTDRALPLEPLYELDEPAEHAAHLGYPNPSGILVGSRNRLHLYEQVGRCTGDRRDGEDGF